MLKERVKSFITEFEMPITKFCRKVEISTDAYYKWLNGKLNFAEKTEARIANYLAKYNF